MAVINELMDAAAELGRNPVVSKHQIQPEYGDEQGDAGRDIAESASRDQIILRHERGQINIVFPCFQLTTCRPGNLTRLINILAICVTIQYRLV